MKIPFRTICLAGALALASVTPAAYAHPGAGSHSQKGRHGPSQQGQTHGKAKGKAKVHTVTYVFRGTWNAATSTVTVKSGNHHVQKAGFVGADVQFDLTGARLVVADTDADGSITATDLKDGDQVVVKARLPRKDPGDQPFKAKMVVDQTNAPTSDGDSTD